MKIKKRPKQNFDINHLTIMLCNLSSSQKLILTTVLELHKKNCKMEYVSLLNEDLYKGIGLSENTFIKHRQSLIDQNYFDTKKVRQGKSFTLQYRPNWSKLQKLDFIKPSVENVYALPKKEYKSKEYFKKGDLITMENRDRLNDDTSYIYELTTYEKDKQIGSPQENYTFGKQIKSAVKSNDNAYKRIGYHPEEYRYLETKNKKQKT